MSSVVGVTLVPAGAVVPGALGAAMVPDVVVGAVLAGT